MEKLEKNRTIQRGYLNNICIELTRLCMDPDKNTNEIQLQLKHLDQRSEELDECQKKIELASSVDALSDIIAEAFEYNLKIDRHRSEASALVSVKDSVSAEETTKSDAQSATNFDLNGNGQTNSFKNARLPKLELPKFSGNYQEFVSFYDKFNACIHNTDIPAVTKFTYLSSLLSGEALASIKGLTITSDNYDAARTILEERYGRKERIIFSHLQKLLSLQASGLSVAALWGLYDNLQTQIRSLQSLDITAERYGVVLTPMVLSRLPEELRMEWAREGEGHENDIQFLLDFLFREIKRRERSQTFSREREPKIPKVTHSLSQFYSSSKSTKRVCVFCNKAPGSHNSEDCYSLKNIPADQVRTKLIENRMCFNCFGTGHAARSCLKKGKCKTCKGHHHTVLHELSKSSTNDLADSASPKQMCNVTKEKGTLMQIVKIQRKNKCGETINLNILFDGGSDRSFITEEAASNLGLRREGVENISFSGFGNTTHSPRTKRHVFSMSLGDEHIELISIKEICADVLQQSVPIEVLNQFPVKFSEFKSDQYIHVDILIGLDYYWSLILDQSKRIEGLVAQKTKLGWMVSGSYKTSIPRKNIVQLFCKGHDKDAPLNMAVENAWSLDNIGISPDESQCEQSKLLDDFENTISFQQGRYCVQLPWNDKKNLISNNRELAKKRLISLNRKLDVDPQLKISYNSYMEDMRTSDMIREVTEEEQNKVEGTVFYLPHRPVVKLEKMTTKIRPVFDASAKGYNQVSLNDCLETGPNLLPSLVEILLRFRRKRIALVADIRKAFLQIKVAEIDQHVLRFLWQDHDQIRDMMFQRVPFGVRSSPFLLNATIKHHLKQFSDSCPVVHELNTNLYVDDFLSGADTVSEATNIKVKSVSIMKRAGMDLTKWSSNDPTVANQDNNLNYIAENTKVLGLRWNPENDTFSFKSTESDCKSTKRSVLSFIAQVFDPLGLISPFTIKVKILFQNVWKENLNWDDPLPEDCADQFTSWKRDLLLLQQWSLPRCFNPRGWAQSISQVELIVFSDASEKAYGTCIYLKTDDAVNLVASKVKVAPIKKITLPRLELLAALLGARFLRFIIAALELPEETPYRCYSDSMITLGWIKGESSRWKQFVFNRVKEIQALTDSNKWKHCVGSENPADLLTRGLDASAFLKSTMWVNGPYWLTQGNEPQNETKESLDDIKSSILQEQKKDVQNVLVERQTTEEWLPIDRWGTLIKAIRILAWVKRFVNKCKNKNNDLNKDLETDEIKCSLIDLIQHTQKHAFHDEMKMILKKEHIPKGSVLQKLNPFLDSDGVLRANTRLNFSELSYDEKYPVIIPKGHLASLIVQEQHTMLKHAGVNQMIAAIRQKYWIIGLRCLARKIKRDCVFCQKLDAKSAQEPMAPLMRERLTMTLPFENVGIDYAGPIFCKDHPRTKYYVLLFTCAVIRAVHLELVISMNFPTFQRAFRRFAARRGLPGCIFSDNFKTFKKAASNMLVTYGSHGPKWRFSVPRAPWWGGWWERMVKNMKSSLKKTVGKRALTKDELETTLVEIEACVNSRPLTFVGDDISVGHPLTPSHFLLGRGNYLSNSRSISTASDKETIVHLSKIWQSRVEAFWKMWRDEYLKQLPLPSYKKASQRANVGSVVLIREDNCPRLQWPLGVIEEAITGKDNIVRTVKVRTKTGVLTRPIQRIHNLECHQSDIKELLMKSV